MTDSLSPLPKVNIVQNKLYYKQMVCVRLKEIRGNRSFRQMADLLNTDHAFYYRVEKGSATPPIYFLEAIRPILGGGKRLAELSVLFYMAREECPNWLFRVEPKKVVTAIVLLHPDI
jgi:transcriptional regulator with XRE-family HTH domain